MAARRGAGEEESQLPPPPNPQRQLSVSDRLETVCGVPLEEGERVLLYIQPSHRTAKLLHIIAGVVLLVALVGIPLLIYGILYERWHLKFVVVTTRRILTKTGNKPVRWLYLKEVVDVRAKRADTAGGGAIGAVAAAAVNAQAGDNSKTDARYWANTQAIIVQGKNGSLSIDASAGAASLGPALANAVWTQGYVNRLPTAHHPA